MADIKGKLLKNMPTAPKEKKEGNVFSRLWTYLKESREELKKVSWPTRKDTLRGTYTVLVFTIIVAVFLGVLDYLFNLGLEEFLTR